MNDAHCAVYFKSDSDNSQTSELHAVCYAMNFDSGFESDVVTEVHAVKSAMRSTVTPTAVTHKST